MNWQKKGEILLIIDRQTKTKQGKAFDDDIKQAQFYYQDKLIALASGGRLSFFQFQLPINDAIKDDVKRLQQRGIYKLVQSFKHPTAHSIPSFCLHNTRTQSHIGIIGGSNKEMIIYDANANQAIRTFNDGHFKHIHTVKFYEGDYCRGDEAALNTFLTASADGCIKLWDLRIGGTSAVRVFEGGHTNRSQTIGFEVSNCYRYLVTGSESRSAFVYDIGSGQPIDKTKNAVHREGVTDISFNPVWNEWASSSIDGHVRVFRYPAFKTARPRPNPGGGLAIKGEKIKIEVSEEHKMADYRAADIVLEDFE